MSTAYGAFSAMFVSLCVLTAILFCLILCCDPPAEQGYNVAADAGGRRGRWPGAQWRRPAPVVVGKPHQLAYFSYPASAEADGDRGIAGASVVVCAICLEALVGGAECRHIFHRGCLALWMKGSITCPLCRLQEACRAGVSITSHLGCRGHGLSTRRRRPARAGGGTPSTSMCIRWPWSARSHADIAGCCSISGGEAERRCQKEGA
ncbi:hypothetical protein ZWY2020_008130 [Hordeum vulgare]|nr:hypothetical protein ZWY2020_008130 [Hordeum vulgare]